MIAQLKDIFQHPFLKGNFEMIAVFDCSKQNESNGPYILLDLITCNGDKICIGAFEQDSRCRFTVCTLRIEQGISRVNL